MLGDPAASTEVWFVLHGYRQLAERFIRRFDALPGAGETRAVVAPEALSRFYIDDERGPHGPGSWVGASWMTREDRELEIRDYVEYLDRVAAEVLTDHAETEAPRVVVLGFSQGAETASRWATMGRVRPAELILWGGGLAADLELETAAQALRRMTVRLVVGSEDRWAEQRSAESRRRLRDIGVEPELLRYAGGHSVAPDALVEHWSPIPRSRGSFPRP